MFLLLAVVEPADTHAATLVLAGRAVRHPQARLIKVAARIVEKTKIKVHLPSAPAQAVVRFTLGRLPRLIT